eukprot:jgi/Botrbrau1/22845/Bobra.0065s0004.1
MLTRGAALWRGLQRAALVEGQGCTCRVFSEVAGPSGRAPTAASATLLETGASSRLFDKIQPPPELGSTSTAGGGAGPEAGAAAGEEAGPSGGIFSTLGNAIFFGLVGAASVFGYYTYRYSTEQVATMVQETKKAENSFPGSTVWVPVMEWYVDQRHKLESEVKKYSDPPSDRLLPDLPPQARSIVRTLVLDLDDLLVHSDWTRGRGWRTFKRPGAEDFLRQMAQYYELVVYTSQLPTYADPILDRLDPNRYIQYRLYRDSTQYTNGRHVRDLSKLNRDLAKVLFITSNPEAGDLQPDNTVVLKPWKMEADDTTLLDMLPFLEAVMTQHVPDVRDVVVAYRGQDIPTAYRQRMKEILEQRRAKASRSILAGLRGQ